MRVQTVDALRRIHYLSVLAVVVMGMRWSQYLWPTAPTLRGQTAAIWLMFIGFGLVLVAWWFNSRRSAPGASLSGFLAFALLTWAAVFIANRVHGDAVNYTTFLIPPILLLIWLKPPSLGEAWSAIRAVGWMAVVMLVGTRLLEALGVLQVRYVPGWINEFDRTNYWLPLREVMGLDGRWPGPFGHNGHTAMAGAILIVIAFAQWRRVSSPVFLVVGVFTLLLINGRASIGAAFVGIAVMVVFSRWGILARVPTWLRLLAAGAWSVVVAFALLGGSAGTTGRQSIWPAFFELWQTSPLLGVGTSGISVSGGLTADFGHAHNLYLDELTRHGLIALIAMSAMLIIGTVIAFRAAVDGSAGGLAIVASYLVLNLTEPRNDWLHPSFTGLLLVLSVLAADAWNTRRGTVDYASARSYVSV